MNTSATKTYQFFYIGPPIRPGIIKWKLDGETADLTIDLLDDRQQAEVDALWEKVDAMEGASVMVYDAVRDWNTGEKIKDAQP